MAATNSTTAPDDVIGSGRVAVVTGAASGIGRAHAEALTVDVADAAAVDQLAATTLERFGRVDVLCNNAGVSTFNLLRDQTLDDWKWVVGVNFWGVVHG